jgi:hypothetical protein
MEQDKKNCCVDAKGKEKKGILSGILYGLVPHSFCIAFAVFSIIGATTATAFLKKFLLIPNLFAFLIFVSLLLATISSIIYLKKTDCLCASGIKKRWRYLSIMYSTTILANLVMFLVVIPALANSNFSKPPVSKGIAASEVLGDAANLAELSMEVQIPCSGHATLIMDEIRKNYAVDSIKFKLPNTFQVKYDPREVSPEKIAALEIFKTYPATIN